MRRFFILLVVLSFLIIPSSAEIYDETLSDYYYSTLQDYISGGSIPASATFNHLYFSDDLTEYNNLWYVGTGISRGELPESTTDLLPFHGVDIAFRLYDGSTEVGSGFMNYFVEVSDYSTVHRDINAAFWFDELDVNSMYLSGNHSFRFENDENLYYTTTEGYGNGASYVGYDKLIYSTSVGGSPCRTSPVSLPPRYPRVFKGEWSFGYYTDAQSNQVNQVTFTPNSVTNWSVNVGGTLDYNYVTDNVVTLNYGSFPLNISVVSPFNENFYYNISIGAPIADIDVRVKTIPNEIPKINQNIVAYMYNYGDIDNLNYIKFKTAKFIDKTYNQVDTSVTTPQFIFSRINPTSFNLSHVDNNGTYFYNVQTVPENEATSCEYFHTAPGYYAVDVILKNADNIQVGYDRYEYVVITDQSTGTLIVKFINGESGADLNQIIAEIFTSTDNANWNLYSSIWQDSHYAYHPPLDNYVYINGTKTGFEAVSYNIGLFNGDKTVTIPMYPTGTSDIYSLTLTILDTDTSQPVTGVVGELDNVSKYSRGGNTLTWSNLGSGTYMYLLTKEGYNDATNTISINGIEDLVIYMTKEDSVVVVAEQPKNIIDSVKYGFLQIFGLDWNDSDDQYLGGIIFAGVIILFCAGLLGYSGAGPMGVVIGGIIGFVLSMAIGLIPLWVMFAAVGIIALYLIFIKSGES